MAGAAADRELMPPAAATVSFSVAKRSDEAELRAFLRDHPTPGAVSLSFEREPDYFRGEGVAGADDVNIVARREGRIVCMGRCTRRELYIEGRRRCVGYLSALRLAPGTPGGPGVLRAGYRFFAEMEAARPADFYFTSVATTNLRARRVLESGRIGLPVYRPLRELVTVASPVRRNARRTSDADEVVSESELASCLDASARMHDLAMTWDERMWAQLREHGLESGDFVAVRRDGRLVAVAGLWKQSAWRQTVVRGYTGPLTWARPLVSAGLSLGGWPRLPTPGEILNQACVHPLACCDGDPRVLAELWEKLERSATARGIDWLVTALPRSAPEWRVIGKSFAARRYATQLYEVILPGFQPRCSPRRDFIRPEVGLL
jgi:hypothetical protein